MRYFNKKRKTKKKIAKYNDASLSIVNVILLLYWTYTLFVHGDNLYDALNAKAETFLMSVCCIPYLMTILEHDKILILS